MSQKEFDQLKNTDQRFYCSSYYDLSDNKLHADFEEKKVGLMKQILRVGFSDTLDTSWVEDPQMIKDKSIDRKKL